MNHDTHLCAICRAEFASSAELVRHEKARHSHHAMKRADARNQYPMKVEAAKRPRQGREFSRRNAE